MSISVKIVFYCGTERGNSCMNCKRQNVEAHDNDDDTMHFKLELKRICTHSIRAFRKVRFTKYRKSESRDDVVRLCREFYEILGCRQDKESEERST